MDGVVSATVIHETGMVRAVTHGPAAATVDLCLFSTGNAQVAGGVSTADGYRVSAEHEYSVALSALVQGF